MSGENRGEGVVTTPSTGEGVVQQAPAHVARVVEENAPGPHAPPANTSTIDRSTVATGANDSNVDTSQIAGVDTGHGPTPAPWSTAQVLEAIAKPGVADEVKTLLHDDAEWDDHRTARQFVEMLGRDVAKQLADGINFELEQLHHAEPSLEQTLTSSPAAVGPSVPAATGEAQAVASSAHNIPEPTNSGSHPG